VDLLIKPPGEAAFEFFGFPVYFYGIILAIAVLVGVLTAYFLYKKFYEPKSAGNILDFSPYMIIIGMLGARLYYCILDFQYYSVYPAEIFNIRQGGLSVHGMIIVGVLALWWFAGLYKMHFAKLLDVFCCGAILAQSIGRWGNFFNSEAFGTPIQHGLKLFVPIENRPYMYVDVEYFHPAFLYESVLDFLIFVVLLLVFRRLSKKPGLVACCYFIMYSAVRIFVEHLRLDSVLNINGVPVAQIVSGIIIIAAAAFVPVIITKSKGNHL
jgi:phosphatidylglycerol:prolipoprotein diacylglycerol transferase